MKPIIIHAREALYFRRDQLPKELLRDLIEKYTFKFYEEKACAQCEFLNERHSEICDDCGAYKGGAELATKVEINGKKFLKTPMGDRAGLISMLNDNGIEYVVKRHFPDLPMSRQIKFIGTLEDFQESAVRDIIRRKRGVLKSPPRTGKTVMITAAICRLGKKAIILASQREWLLGFQETFIGSDTQDPLTDCKKSQIGFAKTLADFERLDVCLVTPQTFLNKPELLAAIRDAATVVAVDEVHTGAAPKYAQVISGLNSEFMWGASGTPSRKDGRFILMRNLLGPNIVEIKKRRLRPEIRLVRTQFKANYKGNVPWVNMVRALEKDPKRLNLIAKWALKDVSRGHMVLIPLAQVTPIKALTEAINRMAGKTIAQAFTGQLKKKERDLCIQNARQYKIKVLVGTTKLLSVGTNIPRASALYDVTMSSNMENCEQRNSRILTPWKDKPQPLLRIFLDDTNVRRNCLASEYYQCIKPMFKPIISQVDEIALKEYLKKKSNNEQPFEW
jgi:superfamily II DNA or RNA helicase